MDRVRDEEVRSRAGIERELASRAEWGVLRWFGHVERMDEYRMARRMLMAEVSGRLVAGGRGQDGWCEGVLGQQRNDGGDCATMRGRLEGVESSGVYVDDWV